MTAEIILNSSALGNGDGREAPGDSSWQPARGTIPARWEFPSGFPDRSKPPKDEPDRELMASDRQMDADVEYPGIPTKTAIGRRDYEAGATDFLHAQGTVYEA